MSFLISALPIDVFQPMFAMSDDELAARGAVRQVVEQANATPCRVSLEDARVGERVLLVNYEHQPANNPYRSRYAVFVREGAQPARPAVNEVPDMLQRRLLSVRAFDARDMLADADVVDGRELAPALERMLASAATAYVHVHFARPGCYAARVDRA